MVQARDQETMESTVDQLSYPLTVLTFVVVHFLPDVMHDVLEGALQHELKLMLQHCILSLQYLRVML